MPVEVLHPMTVHFPIALLLVSFLVETLALGLKIPAWHRVSFWNLILGTWGALAAAVTGGVSAAMVKHPSWQSWAVLERHSLWGALAFAGATGVAAWHLAAGKQMSRRSRWIAWGCLGMVCAIMTFASHLGARLVYEYGVVEVNLP